MDTVNYLRVIVTIAAFVAFVGIVVWAWSRKRTQAFTEAARIPLEDDEVPAHSKPQGVDDTERSGK